MLHEKLFQIYVITNMIYEYSGKHFPSTVYMRRPLEEERSSASACDQSSNPHFESLDRWRHCPKIKRTCRLACTCRPVLFPRARVRSGTPTGRCQTPAGYTQGEKAG